jgi:leucyl aminopeptidase
MKLKFAKKQELTANMVLVVRKEEDLKNYPLEPKQVKHINALIRKGKTSIVLTQFSNNIYVEVCGLRTNGDVLEKLRVSGDKICKSLNSAKVKEVSVYANECDEAQVLALCEGIMLSNYQFLKYLTNQKDTKNSLKLMMVGGENISKKGLRELDALVTANFKSRDLVNEPQSFLNSVQIAEEFISMSNEAGFDVEVWNEAKIESQKMGGILAVNRGSVLPPTFSIMEWKPENAQNTKPYVLVGKGIVYDTGGLSLKPTPNSMDLMKCDMGGAATVAGAMYAIAKNKLPLHVIALVPATDNRPGGDAYAPGDVITMYSGKTVEVLNTDAEGRLVLADALHYASKLDPELVMDFATLTGSAMRAIGTHGTVCMGNASNKTKRELKEAGEKTYERLVEFPMWSEYGDHLKSQVADIKNLGKAEGGAISAGKFLEHFVSYQWMHFDIAGPAFLTSPESYKPVGGTGVGVRMLYSFFKNISESNG